MPSTAIMWFRRDLRLHDLPALHAAAQSDDVLPVFVIDDRLLKRGRFASATRIDFMLGCLRRLDETLRERGTRLVVLYGRAEDEIPRLMRDCGAEQLHFTADVSPFAQRRDKAIAERVLQDARTATAHPGAYVVDDPAAVVTQQGTPYTVFSPFAKAWRQTPRRDLAPVPARLSLPAGIGASELPVIADLGLELPPGYDSSFEPGERAGSDRAHEFLHNGLQDYDAARDTPAGGSSMLSPYLRWGCISPLALDRRAADSSTGGSAFRSELAWRDFYAAVLSNFPHVAHTEFQERYRDLQWDSDAELLEAWQQGLTGYPLVDAGMRQLRREGWMHNRVRMVVGSFLTKDLHINWREGEAHFMRYLIDGDVASNNGGWQWIASTGTDPKPYFQRLFNPITQQKRFDPKGDYVRRWVPQLAEVPTELIAEPWKMSETQQTAAGCVIGVDYPVPIVDHAQERLRAIDRYRAAV